MEELRQLALNDFGAFIKLVCPDNIMGHCHEDLCRWIQDNDKTYKLILWPRDHGKSRYAAFYAAWRLTRDPTISIIYASATAAQAIKMLDFVKDKILDTPKYNAYFSGMINADVGKRRRWKSTEIIVDHPIRSSSSVADTSIFCTGVGANITGRHCGLLVLDDVVVRNNTIEEGEQGREKVNSWVASVASVASVDSDCLVVGTRYHPEDAYSFMITEKHDVYNDKGEIINELYRYTVNQADTEVDGQFLFPRVISKEGKPYGFDLNRLAKIKSQYINNGQITQFYAQYYNDPNNRETSIIARETFRYYDKAELDNSGSLWSIKGKALSVFAAVDLAATIGDKSDYTAIAVGGIDEDGVRYLLDLIRYKSDKPSETIAALEMLYNKWSYKALRIEAVGAFSMVAKDIKARLESMGIRCPIEIYNPGNTHKDVRINNIVEPLYNSQSVFHFRGGLCENLETELVSLHPAHDDLKDAWAMCIDPQFMKAYKKRRLVAQTNVVRFNSRYGGLDYGA